MMHSANIAHPSIQVSFVSPPINPDAPIDVQSMDPEVYIFSDREEFFNFFVSQIFDPEKRNTIFRNAQVACLTDTFAQDPIGPKQHEKTLEKALSTQIQSKIQEYLSQPDSHKTKPTHSPIFLIEHYKQFEKWIKEDQKSLLDLYDTIKSKKDCQSPDGVNRIQTIIQKEFRLMLLLSQKSQILVSNPYDASLKLKDITWLLPLNEFVTQLKRSDSEPHVTYPPDVCCTVRPIENPVALQLNHQTNHKHVHQNMHQNQCQITSTDVHPFFNPQKDGIIIETVHHMKIHIPYGDAIISGISYQVFTALWNSQYRKPALFQKCQDLLSNDLITSLIQSMVSCIDGNHLPNGLLIKQVAWSDGKKSLVLDMDSSHKNHESWCDSTLCYFSCANNLSPWETKEKVCIGLDSNERIQKYALIHPLDTEALKNKKLLFNVFVSLSVSHEASNRNLFVSQKWLAEFQRLYACGSIHESMLDDLQQLTRSPENHFLYHPQHILDAYRIFAKQDLNTKKSQNDLAHFVFRESKLELGLGPTPASRTFCDFPFDNESNRLELIALPLNYQLPDLIYRNQDDKKYYFYNAKTQTKLTFPKLCMHHNRTKNKVASLFGVRIFTDCLDVLQILSSVTNHSNQQCAEDFLNLFDFFVCDVPGKDVPNYVLLRNTIVSIQEKIKRYSLDFNQSTITQSLQQWINKNRTQFSESTEPSQMAEQILNELSCIIDTDWAITHPVPKKATEAADLSKKYVLEFSIQFLKSCARNIFSQSKNPNPLESRSDLNAILRFIVEELKLPLMVKAAAQIGIAGMKTEKILSSALDNASFYLHSDIQNDAVFVAHFSEIKNLFITQLQASIKCFFPVKLDNFNNFNHSFINLSDLLTKNEEHLSALNTFADATQKDVPSWVQDLHCMTLKNLLKWKNTDDTKDDTDDFSSVYKKLNSTHRDCVVLELLALSYRTHKPEVFKTINRASIQWAMELYSIDSKILQEATDDTIHCLMLYKEAISKKEPSDDPISKESFLRALSLYKKKVDSQLLKFFIQSKQTTVQCDLDLLLQMHDVYPTILQEFHWNTIVAYIVAYADTIDFKLWLHAISKDTILLRLKSFAAFLNILEAHKNNQIQPIIFQALAILMRQSEHALDWSDPNQAQKILQEVLSNLRGMSERITPDFLNHMRHCQMTLDVFRIQPELKDLNSQKDLKWLTQRIDQTICDPFSNIFTSDATGLSQPKDTINVYCDAIGTHMSDVVGGVVDLKQHTTLSDTQQKEILRAATAIKQTIKNYLRCSGIDLKNILNHSEITPIQRLAIIQVLILRHTSTQKAHGYFLKDNQLATVIYNLLLKKNEKILQNIVPTGEGKSLIGAVMALFYATENKAQCIDVLQVTEPLARAHFSEFSALYESAGVSYHLITHQENEAKQHTSPDKKQGINIGTPGDIIPAHTRYRNNKNNQNIPTIVLADEYDSLFDGMFYLGPGRCTPAELKYVDFLTALIQIVSQFIDENKTQYQNGSLKISIDQIRTQLPIRTSNSEAIQYFDTLCQNPDSQDPNNAAQKNIQKLIHSIISMKTLIASNTNDAYYTLDTTGENTQLVPKVNGILRVGSTFTDPDHLILCILLNQNLDKKQIPLVRPEKASSVDTFLSYRYTTSKCIGFSGTPFVGENAVRIPSNQAVLRQDAVVFSSYCGGDVAQQAQAHKQLIREKVEGLAQTWTEAQPEQKRNLIIHAKDAVEGEQIKQFLDQSKINASITQYYGSGKNTPEERHQENQSAIDAIGTIDQNKIKILITSAALSRGSDFRPTIDEIKTYFNPGTGSIEDAFTRMIQERGRVGRGGAKGCTFGIFSFQELYPLLYQISDSGCAIDLTYLQELTQKEDDAEVIEQTLQYISRSVYAARDPLRTNNTIKSCILVTYNQKIAQLMQDKALKEEKLPHLYQILIDHLKNLPACSTAHQKFITDIDSQFNQLCDFSHFDEWIGFQALYSEAKQDNHLVPHETDVFIDIKNKLLLTIHPQHAKYQSIQNASDLKALIRIASQHKNPRLWRMLSRIWFKEPHTLKNLIRILNTTRYKDFRPSHNQLDGVDLMRYSDSKGTHFPLSKQTTLYRDIKKQYRRRLFNHSLADDRPSIMNQETVETIQSMNHLCASSAQHTVKCTREDFVNLFKNPAHHAQKAQILNAVRHHLRIPSWRSKKHTHAKLYEAIHQALSPWYAYIRDLMPSKTERDSWISHLITESNLVVPLKANMSQKIVGQTEKTLEISEITEKVTKDQSSSDYLNDFDKQLGPQLNNILTEQFQNNPDEKNKGVLIESFSMFLQQFLESIDKNLVVEFLCDLFRVMCPAWHSSDANPNEAANNQMSSVRSVVSFLSTERDHFSLFGPHQPRNRFGCTHSYTRCLLEIQKQIQNTIATSTKTESNPDQKTIAQKKIVSDIASLNLNAGRDHVEPFLMRFNEPLETSHNNTFSY